MTEQPTDPTDAEVLHDEAPEPTDEQVSRGVTREPGEPTDKPDREAARYRKQLRAKETAFDALAERVAKMQRAEVEQRRDPRGPTR